MGRLGRWRARIPSLVFLLAAAVLLVLAGTALLTAIALLVEALLEREAEEALPGTVLIGFGTGILLIAWACLLIARRLAAGLPAAPRVRRSLRGVLLALAPTALLCAVALMPFALAELVDSVRLLASAPADPAYVLPPAFLNAAAASAIVLAAASFALGSAAAAARLGGR